MFEENFQQRSGVTRVKIKGIYLNVFFMAVYYNDEMNGRNTVAYHDVHIDRHITYVSTTTNRVKLHKVSQNLAALIEEEILKDVRRWHKADTYISWLDPEDEIGWSDEVPMYQEYEV